MSYWSERQDELKEWMEKEEEKLKMRLERYYRTEAKKLDRQIASYYTQYGKDNVIEYRQLMEKLDDEDLTLLIQQMDEFAKKYPQYAHLIPVRESIYKLNRLEGLQYSIKMQQLEMGAVTNEEVENYLIDLGTKGANSSMEAMGFGKNFYSVNSDIVKGFVNTKWSDGKNFSDTIWQNTDKLSKYLNTDVAQGFARGDSYSKLTKMLTDRFLHVSKNDAYRLIYTEGTYVMAESSMQPFTEDFEQYKISTAKDGKVCSTCSKIAQQVFNISERKAGTNFPPFHPWCRCTFTIYVEDWDKWMEDYKRKKSGISVVNIKEKLNESVPQIKIISNSEAKSLREYTQEEILEIAHKNEIIIDKYVQVKTEWSGIIIKTDNEYESSMNEHKDIVSSKITSPMILLHEQLHARSWAKAPKGTYARNKAIEETVVQLLTQEICDLEGFEITRSDGYETGVKILREINAKSSAWKDDLTFATDLINVKLENRLEWLRDKIYNLGVEGKLNIGQIDEIYSLIEELVVSVREG